MSALISFIKAIIVRAISRWILSQVVTLLLSLGLIAGLLIALISFANYARKRLKGHSVPSDALQLG
jgi:dipeptide/tripeptide permease